MNLKAKLQQQFIIIFLFPLIGVYNAFRTRNEKLIVFTGTLFMGIVGSVFNYAEGADGAEHLERLKTYYLDMSLSGFLVQAGDILTFQATGASTDLYIHLLSFISGGIFGIPELLHFIGGLVLGYFFTKSVLLVIRERQVRNFSALLVAFIVLFLTVRSISALNSIRMWTGMWVLFYGSYNYFVSRDKRNLWIILFSIFVHFSYVAIIPVVGVAYLIRKRKTLVTALFALSFVFSLQFVNIQPYIPDLPLLEQKQKYYVVEDDGSVVSPDTGNQNFYKEWGSTVYMNFSIVGLIFLMLLVYSKKKISERLLFLIAAGMLLYAYSNIVGFSPSLSGRTQQVASIFIIASAIYTLLNRYWFEPRGFARLVYRLGCWLFIISAIPFFLFHLSYTITSVSIFILMFPFISWLSGSSDISIRGAIGDIW